MNIRKLSIAMIFLSVIWLLCSAVVYFFNLQASESQLSLITNIVEILIGLTAIITLLMQYYKTKNMLSLWIVFAIISWTLGELFWFSYEVLSGNTLPYPSVGDFGFLGLYFFLAGAIAGFKDKNKRQIISISLAIIIMIVPVFFVLKSSTTYAAVIYNFIYSFAIAFVLYKALTKYTKSSKWFFGGILLFSIADIIFIIEANVKSFAMISDMIYPLAISVLVTAVLKEGETNG